MWAPALHTTIGNLPLDGAASGSKGAGLPQPQREGANRHEGHTEVEPDAYVGRLKKSVLILLAARSLQASGIWVVI